MGECERKRGAGNQTSTDEKEHSRIAIPITLPRNAPSAIRMPVSRFRREIS
jgi:hypothetical protein